MSLRTLFGLSLIVVASLATVFPSAAAEKPVLVKTTSRTIQLTPDIDYFGFDLRTVQNVTVDQCSTACIGDKACKAFTYNPKVKWCFLKSDFAKSNPFPGAIAGKIVAGAASDTAQKQAEPDLGAAPKILAISQQAFSDARQMKDQLAISPDQDGMDVPALMKVAKE